MSHRTVRHGDTEWQVWDVRPTVTGPISPLAAGAAPLLHEWLCMDNGSEKRRIAPIPEGWEAWPDSELAARIAGAQVVERSGHVASRVSGKPLDGHPPRG